MPVKHQIPASSASPKKFHRDLRTRVLVLIFYALMICITARLFYWQVLNGSALQAEAQGQYTRVVPVSGERGKIYTSDNYLLVGNQTVYRLFAQPYLMTSDPQTLAAQLAPLLVDPVVPLDPN